MPSDRGGATFPVRGLIWDELIQDVNESELEELKRIIGIERIERNESIKQELKALVDILSDYQAENDAMRERIQTRPKLKDSQAKLFLKHQLKLLLDNVSDQSSIIDLDKHQNIIQYVLSDDNESSDRPAPPVPIDSSSPAALEPRRRPLTASTTTTIEMRPDSAASTYSAPGGLQLVCILSSV